MSRLIRFAAVTILTTAACVALDVPPARAQDDSINREISSSFKKARAFEKQMKRDDAVREYLRALELSRNSLGAEHPETADILILLADLYSDMGRYADAEPLHKRSLEIREKQLGRDHPRVADSLNNLAILYLDTGRYADAEPLYKRSLEIREKQLGRDHPDVGRSLVNLAVLYSGMGRYADAEPLYIRGLEIQEKQLGRDHPDVAASLNNLAIHAALQRRWDEASGAVDRERRVIRRHVAQVLPGLAEIEQLAFLKANDEKMCHAALSLALVRREDADTVERSAGWVLNGKAVAQEALSQRVLLARDREVPAAVRLATVRQQLAGLTLTAPKPGQEGDRLREIDRLTDQERELSRQLGQAGGQVARDDPWVEVDEVRKALPDDAVLVEISRFRVLNFQAKEFLPPRYAAWVIPPQDRGAVHLIDLGEADAIDEAVAAVRRAIKPDAAALRDRGEPETEAATSKFLEDLANRVLRPLLPHIGKAKRWIVSPDGALWLVHWAALPVDKERYAIEDHAIQYVVSGRDLVTTARGPASKGTALVMADPDYDLDPAAGRQAAVQVLRGIQSAPTELALRGTAAEATAIGPKLQEFTHAAPIVYTGQWALEPVFRAFRRPRVVVLSTHGFFLDDQPSDADAKGELAFDQRPKPGVKAENPLVRCGLLLAGCNRIGQAGDDDGVLTGLEVVGTDLRGTELVVLSACGTGLGDVHDGEGVAGLRQAFQLAGARTVMATLWQVPDKETSQLISRFFEGLAGGKDKAEALRQAQLAQIESRRKRFGGAHPFFWAAFTLTGAPDATGGK
jgi:CHAT domain-containing protein/tetratricopeptide (TPR) repeat protein